MRKLTLLPSILPSFLMLFLCNQGFVKLAASQSNTWCIAKPSSSIEELVVNLDYACGLVDCTSIQEGSTCFYPNTYFHHASFAMNMYFQNTAGNATSTCDFKNSGLIATSDPSYNNCNYYSGRCVHGSSRGIAADDLSQNQTIDTWCVAKPSVQDHLLQENINFACNHVNCDEIQVGGSCFSPPTLRNHASFAMNLYYQNSGRTNTSCGFMATGLVVRTNPSYENCNYHTVINPA